MYVTDTKTVVIGTILMIVALILIAMMVYTEFSRTRRELDAEKEVRQLKKERNYWKYKAEHPYIKVALKGSGWEDIPDEYK